VAGRVRDDDGCCIGNGQKNGRAQLAMRECASNTRAWERFGLSALRALSFGLA
jgi:hypothetical protein